MRYITATEIKEFAYCRRQWRLNRKKPRGHVEVLAPTDPREIGIRSHQRHAEKVAQATRKTNTLDMIIMIAALALAGAVIGTILGRVL